MRIPRSLSLTLCASLVLASLAAARSGDHKNLVVRGRTMDAEGFPIPKTHVWADGGRKASVVSDPDGRFTLEIPIGSPDQIRAKGIRLAVRAERKGWRFAIPGGDAMMALELSIEPGAGGNAQSVAHSNVDRFAAAAAEIVALDGEGAGLTEINFLGAHGEATGAVSKPVLSQTARASLGFSLSASPPANASAVPSSPATAAVPRAEASGGAAGPSPEKSKSAKPSTKSSGSASHRGSSAAKVGGAAVGVDKASKTKGKAPAPTDAEQELSRVRTSAARESVRAAKHAAAHSHDPVAVVQERARRALERAARTNPSDSRDTARAGALQPHATDSGRSAGDTAALRVQPAPGSGGSRSRAAPLVIRAARHLTASGSDSCQCRITGTVEVQSDEPLKRPERVEVSLMWYPQVCDTVELFMGSPRPFTLGPTRCGPQRLHLKVLTSGRFAVRSTDAFEQFQCVGGRVVEQRVVLVPH
jgi:hypothetical protein